MYEVLEQKLSACYKSVEKRFADLKISIKFTLFYFLLLIASITLSNFLYQKIYSNIALNKVSDVSVQTLYSIKANLNLMINNINSYSKMILSDNDIQYLLRNGDIYYDLNAQERVSAYLNKLIQETPAISSIYVFDMNGKEYSVSNQNDYRFVPIKVMETGWYGPVASGRGAYILRLNGGGAFERTLDDNFISMIRMIRDINTTAPIGILVINIPEAAFKESYANIVNNYATSITILDENNDSIIKLSDFSKEEISSLVKGFGNNEHGFRKEKLNGREVLVSYLVEKKYNWKIISIIPIKELSNETTASSLVGFAIIVINSFILFLGSIFISRMITIPIKKLLKSMKGVEKGEFNTVDIQAGDDEIGKLRDGYNIMIGQIRELIRRVIEEQRVKRKAELNVLQAQIKPHFLYNTLDSINSLALSGKTEEVCDVVDALGSYYRLSLSKGKEVITIAEEIEMVKSYLKIQQVRYENMFTVEFDTDERCNQFKILKLVLQPLVENALYHGIRAKGGNGIIRISTKYSEDHIYISVEDDGAGMSEEDIRKIMESDLGVDAASFGLRGTIERLRIFYGVEDCFQMNSKPGEGTKIIISIPVKVIKEANHD
ncbi:MAG: histidine kinase [Clostridia bacterium]|nr:histidine kinase [Clostridia bacterium]